MTKSRIFLYFCLSFIGGIFLSSFIIFPQFLMLGFLILGIFFISVFWQRKKTVVIGSSLLLLTLGIWWHQEVLLNIPHIQREQVSFIGIVGIVAEEPVLGENSIKLVVQAENKEKLLVTTWRYPEYQYGDKIKIIGNLEKPSADINGFNYQNYLKKDGILAVMSWPEIELVGHGFGSPIMKAIFSFKDKFEETTRTFIPPPQEGVLEALVFGDEENISEEWRTKFNLTGTRHMMAVSGMNITIISALLVSFLLALGFWKKQALWLSLVLLALYILMIGAPASAVRAGIMGGLLLLSQILGRPKTTARSIVFAAAAMLAANPLLLKLDIGFQLSFLAVMGMIYFQSFFTGFLRKIPDPKFFPVRTALATTLAAQVFTLPILIYNFGYVSLVSPATNILIVPFLGPVTILIFIFGLSSMIFHGLGWILAWPAWLGLTYILKIIDFFSGLRWASLNINHLPWVWLALFYLVLGFLAWQAKKKEEAFLNY